MDIEFKIENGTIRVEEKKEVRKKVSQRKQSVKDARKHMRRVAEDKILNRMGEC